MDPAGETNSQNMPRIFFWSSVRLDHDSAVRADTTRQNYSVVPRYWYVDATCKCGRCSDEFCFTATEQRRWYEEFGFFVFSYPKNCPKCRRNERRTKELRREYDRRINGVLRAADVTAKSVVAAVIDELVSMGVQLPVKIHQNRKVLANQIARYQRENSE